MLQFTCASDAKPSPVSLIAALTGKLGIWWIELLAMEGVSLGGPASQLALPFAIGR